MSRSVGEGLALCLVDATSALWALVVDDVLYEYMQEAKICLLGLVVIPMKLLKESSIPSTDDVVRKLGSEGLLSYGLRLDSS